MSRRQTAKRCVLKYDRMDRNIRDRKEGGRRSKDGGGGSEPRGVAEAKSCGVHRKRKLYQAEAGKQTKQVKGKKIKNHALQGMV